MTTYLFNYIIFFHFCYASTNVNKMTRVLDGWCDRLDSNNKKILAGLPLERT